MVQCDVQATVRKDLVLVVDDESVDRKAMIRSFTRDTYAYQFAEAETCQGALDWLGAQPQADLALVDYQLPDGTGVELLEVCQEKGVPVVLVTGAGSESVAVKAIRKGVSDYIIKDVGGNYLESLPVIVRNVLGRHQAEAENRKLLQELQAAMEKMRTLQGLIPICADCKSIRNDQGYWETLEGYISSHSMAEFSHGVCPECMKKYLAELEE